MRFEVLGSLEVRDGDRVCTPTAAKPRRVLAVLLCNANRAVPIAELMEELWEFEPPTSAMTTLQTYIFQLRRMLTATGLCDGDPAKVRRILATKPVSYVLYLPDEYVDLLEFRRLSERGRVALERGDYEHASRALVAALQLWQGPALADVDAGPVLRAHALRLHDEALTALTRRIDADLLLGRHRQLVSELTALTAQHPLHEGLHSQLMLALSYCGRRSEALEIYRRLRTALARELGAEPSELLQQAQRAVLRADTARMPVPLTAQAYGQQAYGQAYGLAG